MFKRLYDPVLSWLLNHGRMAIFLALGSFIGAGILHTQASKTFTPIVDVADLIVQLEKLSSIPLEETIDIDLPAERGLDLMGLNETSLFLVLKQSKQWQLAAKSDLK